MNTNEHSICLYKDLKTRLIANPQNFRADSREGFFFLIGNVIGSMVCHTDNVLNQRDINCIEDLDTIDQLKLHFDFLQGIYGYNKKISRNRNYKYLCAAIALYLSKESLIHANDRSYLHLGLTFDHRLLYT